MRGTRRKFEELSRRPFKDQPLVVGLGWETTFGKPGGGCPVESTVGGLAMMGVSECVGVDIEGHVVGPS